ncbi:polysaccharide lyase family 8 protein [Flagelloscypha sp. PMI_526]|nr:polysaccharide lyase family 8 protein [Flagelloscypha sp. PMI_526]
MLSSAFLCTLLLLLHATTTTANLQYSHSTQYGRHHRLAHRHTENIEERDTSSDVKTLLTRRNARVVGGIYDAGQISKWLKTLGGDGKWPDSEINYATQCAAQNANWPASEHWSRIVTMSSAYYGIPGVKEWAQNAELQKAISRAMDWWFVRDFNANPSCQDSGDQPACPCDPSKTPTQWMWNRNWFSNIILIPRRVGQTCLLMKGTLSPTQLSNCTTITKRAAGNLYHPIRNVASLTGANLLDVAGIAIDGGIHSGNISQISDAYFKIHTDPTGERISDTSDGIKVDGAFGQHDGLLYNGNYGHDLYTDVLALETAASGTQWAASDENKAAVETLFDGNRWMIIRNTLTNVLHWDLSPLVRMITFPVNDNRPATSSILTNLTEVQFLGNLWNSKVLKAFANDLMPNTSNPNAGGTTGMRVFWTNDYVVARGKNYVTTLKMFSSRTRNTECTNSQNIKGFHLGDGASYTYVDGAEYEDVVQAWDWELIPGTTSDYGSTPLTCENTKKKGLKDFVGGATDGKTGTAAMSFTNPVTKSLSWNKAWFFLEDDVQFVLVSNISSTTANPVYSVLDQKRQKGAVMQVPAGSGNGIRTWHNGVGYSVPLSGDLEFGYKTVSRQGDWSAIGTSTVPGTNVDMFTATVKHKKLTSALGYALFPGTDFSTFQSKSSSRTITVLSATSVVSAIYDKTKSTVFFAFWNAGTLTVDALEPGQKFTMTTSAAIVGFVKVKTGAVTLSDPTQKQTNAKIVVNGKSATVALPGGRDAGKSVSLTL